jgi:RNA polymerase sigma-70 factor, ECF subfamily
MSDRVDAVDVPDLGVFEARYLAFLETISHLRPKLHRYCSRMTGSVLDGEDVVQEALFLAYRKLDTFDDRKPLAPWLFRIAHNRCVDVIRQREARQVAETEAAPSEVVPPEEAHGPALTKALEHLVLTLPPKERACVLLKDVFDYSLEEIAELVDSTVGGVKAALNRGRAKLASQQAGHDGTGATAAAEEVSDDGTRADKLSLLRLYVDRFNRRDWDGLRELITDDARIRVADRFAGRFVDSPYIGRYKVASMPYRLEVAEIDGELGVVILSARADRVREASPEYGGDAWQPRSIVRLEVGDDGRIGRITDYVHCPWVLASVQSLVIEDAA